MRSHVFAFGWVMAVTACGGATEIPGDDAGSSTGGSGSASQAPPCADPLPYGKPCSPSAARCVGPCSNSWQAENVCTGGKWDTVDVVPCGPNADDAPQCRNSFSGGGLSPCCPEVMSCTGRPDGYPGFGCTPGQDSFCSCTCNGGEVQCGC
jgi:hypothetical protein